MARKNYTAEQIIGMLREAEVRLSQGKKTGAICRGARQCATSPAVLPEGYRQSDGNVTDE